MSLPARRYLRAYIARAQETERLAREADRGIQHVIRDAVHYGTMSEATGTRVIAEMLSLRDHLGEAT